MNDAESRKFIERWIKDEWTLITYQEAKLLNRIVEGPQVSTLEPEWMQQRGYPRYVTAQCSGGNTVTFSGYFNGSAMSAALMKLIITTGTILELRTAGAAKQVQITDTDFTDLAVSAVAYGGTSWANDGSPADYLIVSNPGKDKDSFSNPRSLPRNMLQTYTQIFKRHVESHFQRERMAMHLIKDEKMHQVKLLMRDIKDEMQRVLLYSRPSWSGAAWESALAEDDATMAGIDWWCDKNQTDEANTTIDVDAGGAPLSQLVIDTMVRNLRKTENAPLDSAKYEIWIHGDTKFGAQDFDARYRRITGKEDQVGWEVKSILTREGVAMEFIADDLIAEDLCYIVPTNQIESGYFKDDTLRRDRTNTDPRFTQEMIHCGRWGLLVTNPRWIGRIKNLGSPLA